MAGARVPAEAGEGDISRARPSGRNVAIAAANGWWANILYYWGYIKYPFVTFISFITAFPFATNSFGAFEGKKPPDFTWEWVKSLSAGELTLSIVSFLSSLIINTVSHVRSIPDAFYTLYTSAKNFRRNSTKQNLTNLGILVLAIVACIAAGAIGYEAFLWAGSGWAIINSIGFGFIFWATRFFGLTRMIARIDTWRKQHHYSNELFYLKEEYYEALYDELAKHNRKWRVLGKDDKNDIREITDILRAVAQLQSDQEQRGNTIYNSDAQRREYIITATQIVLATLAAICICPTFAQKFFDGMNYLINHNDGTDPTQLYDPNNSYNGAIAFCCVLLSIGTPVFYMSQVLMLSTTLYNSYLNITNGDNSHKAYGIALAMFLIAFNFFSSAGVYMVTNSVLNNTRGILSSILPSPGSAGAHLFAIGAGAAAGLVNTKMSYEIALKHPLKENHKQQTISKAPDSKQPGDAKYEAWKKEMKQKMKLKLTYASYFLINTPLRENRRDTIRLDRERIISQPKISQSEISQPKPTS
jgi:hypothetical protein